MSELIPPVLEWASPASSHSHLRNTLVSFLGRFLFCIENVYLSQVKILEAAALLPETQSDAHMSLAMIFPRANVRGRFGEGCVRASRACFSPQGSLQEGLCLGGRGR